MQALILVAASLAGALGSGLHYGGLNYGHGAHAYNGAYGGSVWCNSCISYVAAADKNDFSFNAFILLFENYTYVYFIVQENAVTMDFTTEMERVL